MRLITLWLACLWLLIPLQTSWAAVPDESELLARLKLQRTPAPLPKLLVDLETQDSRLRWLAAKELGRTDHIEVVPHLMRRLDDRNLEVRRRSKESLLMLGLKRPAGFSEIFKSGLAGLDPVSVLVAEGINEERMGRLEQARTKYHQAFEKDNRRLWAAFWAYDTSLLLRKIEALLAGEMAETEKLLQENISRPQVTYPESLLRQAYSLIALTQAIARRVGSETIEQYARGRTRQAEALNQPMGRLLSSARELSEVSKGLEIKLFQRVSGFQFSDYDPVSVEEEALAVKRAEAALQLAGHKTARAEIALLETLRTDPSPQVRARAAEALGLQGGDSAAEALLTAFKEDQALEVKKAAVQALGLVADPRAKELIYRVVQQDDFKEDALLAMGLRATSEDLAFLHRAALNRDFITRKDYILGVLTEDKETVLLAIAKAFETAASRRPAAESEELRHKAEVIRGWAANYSSFLDENALKSVVHTAQPAPAPPRTLESDQQIISGLIKKWLEAWRRQDLDEFLRYYHPDFHYQGMDLRAYKAYKAQTAGKHGQATIAAEDISIEVKGATARVTFLQDYRAENYSDFGQKTLVLVKQGATWLIKQETWTKREK